MIEFRNERDPIPSRPQNGDDVVNGRMSERSANEKRHDKDPL